METIVKYRKLGAFAFWGGYQIKEDFAYQTQIVGHQCHSKFYTLTHDGVLKIKWGFAWNGPNCALKTDDFVVGSCIHDALCDMTYRGLLPSTVQPDVDREMFIVNGRQGMSKIRQWYTYKAVRWYQDRAKKNRKKEKVYQATIEG